MVRLITTQSKIDRDNVEMIPGIPSGVRFNNLPESLLRLLDRPGSFYVPGDEAYKLASQVGEVECCGKPSFRTEIMRNKQLAYWLTTECSKRHGYTNRVLRTRNGNRRGAEGFQQIDVTPEQAQRSYEEEMDRGMISVWTETRSAAGMHVIHIAPMEYSRLLLEGNILLGRCSRLHENPQDLNVSLFSAAVPWGRHKFMGGNHTFAYTVANNGLCISIDFGDGYVGRLKKSQMAAHMGYLKHKGQFVLHMGVGNDIGILGSSGVGKSQIVEPEPPEIQFLSALEMIRQVFPDADINNVAPSTALVIKGEKKKRVRALVIDDIAAVFIDPSDGSMWVYCLEAGYYIRIDQWDRLGVMPVIDKMANSPEAKRDDAIWSNVDVVDGVPQMNSFHDLEGEVTQNPRVSVRKTAYDLSDRTPSDDENRHRLKHLIVATAAGFEDPYFWPAASIVSLPQAIALAGPSYRSGAGTQSISATGQGLVADPGFTQAQFTPLGYAQVTEEVVTHLRNASPSLSCYAISQRASTVFRQPGLYDALFTLRRMIESGVDLTKYMGRRLPGKYYGWAIRHPDIDPRITDPYETIPSDILHDCARRFDNMIMRYWLELLGRAEITPETERYIKNLIGGNMPATPSTQFELTIA